MYDTFMSLVNLKCNQTFMFWGSVTVCDIYVYGMFIYLLIRKILLGLDKFVMILTILSYEEIILNE